MFVEALSPLTVKLPDGEIHLVPGRPVNMPEGSARKLLEKAPGKVRAVKGSPEWLSAWRKLADLTGYITSNDPRFAPIIAGLSVCDEAFASDDWSAFQRAAEQVKAIVRGRFGA